MSASRAHLVTGGAPRGSGLRGDIYVYVALLLVSVAVRIPYLKTFDLVAYDGTYYINLARSILHLAPVSGPFPIGYPLLIAPLLPLADDVRAAQAVSLVASLAALAIFFVIAKRVLERMHAIAAVFVLAVTPLFVRSSLMALSEATYLVWLLLGIWCYATDRDVRFGLSMGAAAITRPEALAIFAVLGIARVRALRRLVPILASFATIYAINVAIFSISNGELVLVQKSEFFGTSASSWQLREAWADFEGRDQLVSEMTEEHSRWWLLRDYAMRLPRELGLLIRHLTPILFGLALYGIYRRRVLVLIATLVPFFLYPLVTPRSEYRYVLPYIPTLILFAFIAIEHTRNRALAVSWYVMLGISVAGGVVWNQNMLTVPISDGYQSTREAALEFRDQVKPGERMADRKPYFAFYAGLKFEKLPAAPYDDTLNYLFDQHIDYLALHVPTTHQLRPALRPLLYDRDQIMGELRYKQVFSRHTGEVVYKRTFLADPLKMNVVTPRTGVERTGPAWSPDGKWVVFRVAEDEHKGGIFLMSGDGNVQRVITENAMRDPIAWAPDSHTIAFARLSSESMDIYTYDIAGGELTQITTQGALDASPSWSADGKEIAFVSERTGLRDIWIKNLETGKLEQVTREGENGFPAFSPDGRQIAYVNAKSGLCVLDRATGRTERLPAPPTATFVPSWRPQGDVIAFTGIRDGGSNVYLASSDLHDVLKLTKNWQGMGMPSWSPDGESIVCVQRNDRDLGICIVEGIDHYLNRLRNPVSIRTFSKPDAGG